MKKTKRLLPLLLSALILFSVIIIPVYAYDTNINWELADFYVQEGSMDGIEFMYYEAKSYYDDYTKTFYVFRNTDNDDIFVSSFKCIPGIGFNGEVPKDVEKVVIGSGVMNISNTFNDLPNLEVVELGDSVRVIEDSFNNCPNIRKITNEVFLEYQEEGDYNNTYDHIIYRSFDSDYYITPIVYAYKGTYNEKLASDKKFEFVPYPEMVSNIDVLNVVNGVKISWNTEENFSQYTVYRSGKGGSLDIIAKTGDLEYIDKTVKNNSTHYYVVVPDAESEIHFYGAHDTYQYSTWIDQFEHTRSDKITYLASPVIKSIDNSTSGATIKWGKVAGATSYYVYRKTTGGWTRIATTKSTSFTDKTAKSGVEYRYTLRAVKSGAVSAAGYSKENVFYKTPTLKSLTAAKGKNTLTFSAVNEADFYVVYRKTNGGAWERLSKITSTTYIDKDIVKGKTYTYTVRASDGTFRSYYNTKGLSVKAK